MISNAKITIPVILLIGVLATAISARVGRAWSADHGGALAANPPFVPGLGQKTAAPDKNQIEKERLRYGGKDFNAWKDALQVDLQAKFRVEAIKALGEFAKNGYAPEATAAIVAEVAKCNLDRYDDKESEVIWQAEKTLAGIGPKAYEAMARELENKDVRIRQAVAYLAGQFTIYDLKPDPGDAPASEAFALFLKAIKNDDIATRRRALDAVGNWVHDPPFLIKVKEPQRKEFLATTLKALDEKDARLLKLAIWSAGHLGSEARPCVPALIKLLQEGMVRVTGAKNKERERDDLLWWVIGAFEWIGPAALDAAGPLAKVLENDALKRYHEDAMRALGDIGPAAGKEAVPVLIKVIEQFNDQAKKNGDLDWDRARAAFKTLPKMGRSAKDALPVLIRTLAIKGFYPKVQYYGLSAAEIHVYVVATLSEMGPIASDAVPKLLEIQADGTTSDKLRIDVADALKKIQK